MLCRLQGYLSVNYSDNYYKLSQRFEEVPRLTPAHYEAMALFNELAKRAALSACAAHRRPACILGDTPAHNELRLGYFLQAGAM